MSKIILILTSHIASQSIMKVKEAIEKEKPDCVAVELDINRLMSFQQEGVSNLNAMKRLGITTFLVYWIMKKLQDWLGKKVGILPGSEMITAVRIARQKGIKVALIDQDINITFTKIQKMPLKEKLRLVWFLVKNLTVGLLLSKLGKGEKIDLSKVPPNEIIKQAMNLLKKEFPGLYKILVTDRNIVMSNNIKHISKQFKKIIVVIGAGHYDGMKKLLAK